MNAPIYVLPDERRFVIWIVIAAALFSFAFLEYNNHSIRKANPSNVEANAASLVRGQTVFSIDNEYYLSPVDNYLSGKGWRRGAAVGDGDYLRRVPGYSLLYFAFIRIFGTPEGFIGLKIFQVLIFLSTIPLVYYLSRQVSGVGASRLIICLYSFTPFFSSWAYFTLTEAISPALTTAYVYFAWRGAKADEHGRKLQMYVLSSLFLAAAILTRPYIALAGIILVYFSFRDFLIPRFRLTGMLRLAAVWILPSILIGIWAWRNYRITGEIVFLEKAYHPQSLDRMKPEFRGMFTFTKSWGEDGADFTRYHEPFFWPVVKNGDTSSAPIHKILRSWPSHVVAQFGYTRLYDVLKTHQSVLLGYKPYYQSLSAMPDSFTMQQLQAEAKYRQLIKEYRTENPLHFYLLARLQYLKRAIFHSNTANVHVLQSGNVPTALIAYKGLLYAFHVLIYLTLLLNLFLLRGSANRVVFVYAPLLLLIFLCFVHREVEARYMLPLLPLVIVGSSVWLDRILLLMNKWRS